jgi:hypothetical protein
MPQRLDQAAEEWSRTWNGAPDACTVRPGQEVRYHGERAPDAQRPPRKQVTYVPAPDRGLPHIESVASKIVTAERRHAYLDDRLKQGDYASSSSANYDRAELRMLESALKLLRYAQRMQNERRAQQ